MNFPRLADNVWKLGITHWDRRLFDSLIMRLLGMNESAKEKPARAISQTHAVNPK